MKTYQPNRVNHCPGCDRTHWYIGRTTAECGFCATAVPLADSQSSRTSFIQRGKAA